MSTTKAELSLLKLFLTYTDFFDDNLKAFFNTIAARYPDGKFKAITSGVDAKEQEAEVPGAFHFSYILQRAGKQTIRVELRPYIISDRVEIHVHKYGYLSPAKMYREKGPSFIEFIKKDYFVSDAFMQVIARLDSFEQHGIDDAIQDQLDAAAHLQKFKDEWNYRKGVRIDELKEAVYAHFKVKPASFDDVYDAVKALGSSTKIIKAIEKLLPLLK